VGAVALAFLASLSWGLADFLGGVTSRRLSVLSVLLVAQGIAVLALGMALLIGQDRWPGTEFIPYAVVSGLAEAVALYAFYRGLAVGAMGVVAPLSATAAVLPVLVGIADGESPSPLEVTGIVLAVVGAIMVSRQADDGLGGARLARGVGLALVAAVGFGIFFTLLDTASEHGGTGWAVFVNRVVLVMLLAVVAAATRAPVRLGSRELPLVGLIGVLDVSGALLYSAATTRGLLSLAAVVASMYPVVTILLARALLKERLQLVQRVGAVLALAGVVAIAL
jgi:uncharacterized membrane protein